MKILLILTALCSVTAFGEGFRLGDALKNKAKPMTINVNINNNGVAAPTGATPKKAGFFACSVEAFTEKYEGTGQTETAAKFKARSGCLAKHDEMFCKDVTCEGEAESTGQWICRVKAFGESFETLADSKTEAKYKVRKDCVAKNNEMHCTDITCEQ